MGPKTHKLEKVIEMNAGMHLLRGRREKSRFMFVADDAIVYDPAAIEKVLIQNEAGVESLIAVREVLATEGEWNGLAAGAKIRSVLKAVDWDWGGGAADSGGGERVDDQPADLCGAGISGEGTDAGAD